MRYTPRQDRPSAGEEGGVALTDAEVLHVAELARLALTDAERARIREQLSSILGYMEILNELDTSAILPTAQVIESSPVMRPDEVSPSLDRALALMNAPDAEEGYFKVNAVLDVE
jgi:aspartyl-tRNA(Asn)/glutamyl-tRNA(Gln) amidotransferase subunit C